MRAEGNRRRRGFTLLEMLVTMAVVLVVMLGLLTMLESSSRVAKQEAGVAGAQAASRSGLFEVSRILRQARTGQLYPGSSILPYVNNAPAGTTLTDLSGTVHTIREGTDAVEARGIFRGEMDYFGLADVACSGAPCTAASNAITVSIPQLSPQGLDNYPAGGKPAAANRSRGFYFVVTTTLSQNVTAGAGTYTTPLYAVGRVAPASVTATATATSFVLDATDPGARAMNATADTSLALAKPFSGGVVDDVLFFVDRGLPDRRDATSFPHPFLAEAVRDPDSGGWDVQPVVPDVEDFQIAYGIDGSDGGARDRGVDPARVVRSANGDEWVFDTPGESLSTSANPTRVDAFIDTSVPSSPPNLAPASPALKEVLLSILVRSSAPERDANGPGAFGQKLLDSTARPLSTTTAYKRRSQTMAVTLRNYL